MKVFQYFINPKINEDLLIDSLCYEPQNIYEKRLGSLYIIGNLKNALPKNQDFIDKLGKFIKEKYYKKTLLKPEKALKEVLKEANDYLANIVKEGNVNWLGNLSLVILNLKNYNLNFTKVGDIKIYLIRGKKIHDIDEKIKIDDIEPYPLKVFGNVVSGKLIEGDVILLLSKEIFLLFQKENLIQQLVETFPFEEKNLKKILEEKKEALSKIKGIIFLLIQSKKAEKERKEIISSPKTKEFSLREFFNNFYGPFINQQKPQKEYSFRESLNFIQKHFFFLFKNKKLILILLFIFLLISGYFLFNK